MGLPVVSVLVPTYNHPRGLRRTLGCITSQTYENLQIIVSDNCSEKPEVQEVIGEFAGRDSRITAYRQPQNGGVQANYRFLADRAKGKYLMFAQDDDWWTPHFIENLVAYLEANPAVPLAACPTRYINCQTKEPSKLHFLNSVSVYRCVGNGEMGMAVMGIWRRRAYLNLEAREIPDTVSGVDHTAAALALLCGGIGVVASERYHKGHRPGRFGQAFDYDRLYSFRAWYYYLKTVARCADVPTEKKLLLPLIAVANFSRACLITGVHLLFAMPDNPVKRAVQNRVFSTN